MTNHSVLGIFLSVAILAFLATAQLPDSSSALTFSGGSGTINQLDQWRSDGTNITQQVANRPVKLTGLTPGGCLELTAGNVATTTGLPCAAAAGDHPFATSSAETAGELAYYTSTSDYPVTLGKVATGTLSCTSGISCTSRSVIGGSTSLTLDTSGDWQGTFDSFEGSHYLSSSFSTTSADHWETLQTARTADDLSDNSIGDLSDVASITENYGDLFGWNGSAWSDFSTSSLDINFVDLVGSATDAQVANNLTISSSGSVTWSALTSYPTGCTDEFVRSIGDTLTCDPVANSDLANSSITINGTSISLGGSDTITAASSTLLGDVNGWSGLQTFSAGATTTTFHANGLTSCTGTSNKLTWSGGNFGCETDQTGGGGSSFGQAFEIDAAGYLAPTTTIEVLLNDGFVSQASSTVVGGFNLSNATVKQHLYPAWVWPTVATTTTATATVPLGSAFVAELWNFSECRVTSGSGGYRYGDGTNFMDYLVASTTEGRYPLSSNSSFTTGERRVVEVGPLTNAQLTCTVDKTINN